MASSDYVLTSDFRQVPLGNVLVSSPNSPNAAPFSASGVLTKPNVATADPVVSNDQTQGYSIGSTWYNTTSNRIFVCLSAATGAAKWGFVGGLLGTGSDPSGRLTQFGAGVGNFTQKGTLTHSVTTGVSPGTTANDNVLAAFSLPANSLTVAGRGITITANGSFGATANNKTLKLIVGATTATVGSAIVGGTTILSSGVVATNGLGWSISANLNKYGALNANTQMAIVNTALFGTASLGALAPVLTTLVENAVVIVAVTGNAATATTDIVLNNFEIEARN